MTLRSTSSLLSLSVALVATFGFACSPTADTTGDSSDTGGTAGASQTAGGAGGLAPGAAGGPTTPPSQAGGGGNPAGGAGAPAAPPTTPAEPPGVPTGEPTPSASGGGASPGTGGAGPGETSGETSSGGSDQGGAPGTTDGTSTSDTSGAAGETTTGSGGGSGGGGGGEGCDAAGVAFCTDFESDSLPAELQFYPEYQRDNIANFVTIDSTQSASGSRSVKVVGSDFSQMLGVETPGSTFWGRIYLMSDTDIQQGHNTYVAATDSDGDPNNGEDIRIGEHQCQLEVNRKSDDAEKLSNGGTYECSGGFEMSANTWYCLEFFYDGPGSTLQVFVDGTEIPELHATDWGPYDYRLFKFGFEKYHGDAKTLWYDDLALGSQRIGCSG